MAATATNEVNETMDSPQVHEEGSLNKSLLSVLSAMQENLASSSSMLRDLVEGKRKSSEIKQHRLPNGQNSVQKNRAIRPMLRRKRKQLLHKK